MTRRPVRTICRVLHIGKSTVYRARAPRPRRYATADDRAVHAQLKAVLRERASYGYRRATVLVNRAFGTAYNRKRVQRVMELTGLALPRRRRPRTGRPHRGRIRRDRPNERWCSDAFEIACWNGEVVEVAFVLDCCDRECIAIVAEPRDLAGADVRELMRRAVAARFGGGVPARPIQWLSDNEGMSTALETVISAERLGLAPITTPVRSPESNGMSEAFVGTMRRDYLDGAELGCAAAVLEQLPRWLADYNHVAPHSALGYLTPTAYRQAVGAD
jgi:putative transposase